MIHFILDACGGVLYAPNGTITSPSFPDLYPASKNCLWEIVAPPQHRITLNFTHFDLEGSNNMYHQVINPLTVIYYAVKPNVPQNTQSFQLIERLNH